MNTNYNKLVDALKVIARDFLRMKIVVRLQSELAGAQDHMNHVAESIKTVSTDIAQTTYDMSKVDEANPSAERLMKVYQKSLDELNEDLAELKGEVTTCAQKEIDRINAEIVEVQEGKKKVNLDDLNAYTKVLLDEVTKKAAVTAAESISA